MKLISCQTTVWNLLVNSNNIIYYILWGTLVSCQLFIY